MTNYVYYLESHVRELEATISRQDDRTKARDEHIEHLKRELERRLETHEVHQRLEEMLRRERLLSEDRLHHIKRRDDSIQHLINQVNQLETVIDRVVGLLTKD